MKHKATSALLFVAGLTLAACSPPAANSTPTQPPLTIEETDGSELSRLRLSASAVARLGIETVAVGVKNVGGVSRSVIPYAALIYDAEGSTWAYTNPEGLVYTRAEVTVERIDGEDAILTDGPAAGTFVVTVGGAELWGAEHGVGGGH
ncbi:MAG: hypothetical protein AABZ33_08655 [Chloroflexota bacterium]